LANNIVDFRNANGSFTSRKMLKKVPRMGAKSFEQSAGFLRIITGNENPLDASGVHPEAYSVVEAISAKTGKAISDIIGDTKLLKSLNPADYVTEKFGLPTVTDIIAELDKPGRDPRPEFKTATLKDGIEKISDLKEDMILEGTVTNVTNFGAFVDVGVHQDGLVHISCLADKFVDDPHKIVKAGQIVKVKVQEIDIQRKRIALTMRLQDSSKDKLETKPKQPQRAHKPSPKKPSSNQKYNQNQRGSKQTQTPTNSLADKLSAALKNSSFKK
jgi:uncharacterized protein